VRYGPVLLMLVLMVLPCYAPFTPAVRSAHLFEGHTGVQWAQFSQSKTRFEFKPREACHV
jgi:hypothetical protein